MMIETCVDIAGHVISDKALRSPTSYSDAFKVLHENTVLPKELFNKMGRMAKFRNIVVHHYDNIAAEIVVGILKRDLDHFIGFRKAIVSLLEEEQKEQSPDTNQ